MRVKRKYNIRGLTQPQKEWLQRYREQTFLEPLGLEALAADALAFDEWARLSISCFEGFSIDVLRTISNDVPYNERS